MWVSIPTCRQWALSDIRFCIIPYRSTDIQIRYLRCWSKPSIPPFCIIVPANTTATLGLPVSGEAAVIQEAGKDVVLSEGVTFLIMLNTPDTAQYPPSITVYPVPSLNRRYRVLCAFQSTDSHRLPPCFIDDFALPLENR